jgi:hypothetical protein
VKEFLNKPKTQRSYSRFKPKEIEQVEFKDDDSSERFF